MTKAIVRVENVSKQYRIAANRGPYSTLREAVTRAALAPVKHLTRNGSSNKETLWALNDINFEVGSGEILGIIGRNGAGKSTLLKILARITQPTSGRVELFGRIGSLLEVGTGFHPELTGRENIYLNGAVLGMRRTEIADRFDEIVAFAEMEKFLDTPVKHYSSGMYMRLAFAVAAHLNPEILLMDEVLAVGDAAFQAKCLGKMDSVASEGRTVLFVSHNLVAVQNLCKRVIWLNEGKILEQGPTHAIVNNYLAAASSSVAMERVWDAPATAPGNEKVRIRSVRVRATDDSASDVITVQTPFVLEFEYWNLEPDARLNLSLHLYNQQGITVLNTVPMNEPEWHGRAFPVGLFRSACHIPGNLLNDGLHRVLLLVVKDQGTVIFTLNDALVFSVQDVERPGDWHGRWEGAVRPDLVWSTEYLDSR
ncbi:MAG TPA: ABC transporter ATP-binding protein [Pyrinomonadaceae bacterium]